MKRKISLFLCLTMVLFFVAGCSNKDLAETSLFKPGKYIGEGKGFGGLIKVEVEVSDSEILSIEVLEQNETKGISDPVFERIPSLVVENQSINVDAISGATMASEGLIGAIKNALEQTASDMEVLNKKIEEAKIEGKFEKTTDVVIIGSGGAGMSAAKEVVDAGLNVIILDKLSSVGGNTLMAGSALNAADPFRQEKQKMSKTEMDTIEKFLNLEAKDEFVKKWQEILSKEVDEYKSSGGDYLFDSPTFHKLQTYVDGDYVGNPSLIDILGDNALGAVEFLEDLGAKWNDEIQAAVGATWKRSHTPTTDYGLAGSSFVLPQVDYVKSNGGEIILESKVEEILMEDGKVIGVKGHKLNGQEFEIRANKGVIIATGGFAANVEMRQKYNKHWANLDESVATTNGAQATGDGIIMGEALGANLVGMEWIQLIPTYGKGVFTPYIENQFYINKNGERFVAEDGRRDVLAGAILEQEGSQTYIISDANTVKDGMTTIGVNVDERMEENPDLLWKADSLEALAELIGVPYENLKKTVDTFNKSVKNGNDPLGRNMFDKEFGQGPFYAGLTGPMVHHTMGGLEITEKAEVLDKEGNIIEGLYAAGEVTGGIHGANRLGGNAIADIIVFGRIAGREISK